VHADSGGNNQTLNGKFSIQKSIIFHPRSWRILSRKRWFSIYEQHMVKSTIYRAPDVCKFK